MTAWTKQNIETLKAALERHGNDYATIQERYFPLMSIKQLKAKKYYLLLTKQVEKVEDWREKAAGEKRRKHEDKEERGDVARQLEKLLGLM